MGMKKIYVTPEMEIVKIQDVELLTISNPDITFEGLDDMDGFGGTDEGEYDPS